MNLKPYSRGLLTFFGLLDAVLIGQYLSVSRDPDLYLVPVRAHSSSFSGSALFSYRLNWQTALYLGYGDERALDARDHLGRVERQLFAKISYAFQRCADTVT